MALDSLKIEMNRLEEGQWFNIGGIDFLIRGIDKTLAAKMDKLSSKKRLTDKIKAMNEFVFNDLVKDWRGMTTEKLQSRVVSDTLHKKSAWFDVCGINFHLKRITPADVEEFALCTNDDAKLRKKVRTFILDWENFKFTDEDENFTPYSKKRVEDIFTQQEYRVVTRKLQDLADDASNFIEQASEDNIPYSDEAKEKYLVNVDTNNYVLDIVNCSKDEESYRQELIEKDVEMAKK